MVKFNNGKKFLNVAKRNNLQIVLGVLLVILVIVLAVIGHKYNCSTKEISYLKLRTSYSAIRNLYNKNVKFIEDYVQSINYKCKNHKSISRSITTQINSMINELKSTPVFQKAYDLEKNYSGSNYVIKFKGLQNVSSDKKLRFTSAFNPSDIIERNNTFTNLNDIVSHANTIPECVGVYVLVQKDKLNVQFLRSVGVNEGGDTNTVSFSLVKTA